MHDVYNHCIQIWPVSVRWAGNGRATRSHKAGATTKRAALLQLEVGGISVNWPGSFSGCRRPGKLDQEGFA